VVLWFLRTGEIIMGIQIIVCIKSIITNGLNEGIVRLSDSREINPYDRPVLEVALRIREELSGTITALSMGPEPCAFALNEAMAMGVDRGVLLCDPALAGADTLATSNALAAAIKKLAPFDLVLFGSRAADSDTGQVGPQTAVLLDLPMVTGTHSVEAKADSLIAERSADGFLECFEVFFPAGLSIHSGANQPRDVGLLGIELGFEERDVIRWNLEDLDLSADRVGEVGSATNVLALSRVESARKCEFLIGSAVEQVDALIDRLSLSGMF
jgi:electron transfer flavoprotein beta subunit